MGGSTLEFSFLSKHRGAAILQDNKLFRPCGRRRHGNRGGPGMLLM